MAGIGDYLKQVRQQRGYSLEDVNRLTNIHTKYLYLLENDRFDLLPSPFYAKAFLRTYAKSLGIDAKPLLDHLDKIFKNNMHPHKSVRNAASSSKMLPRYNKKFLPISSKGKSPEESQPGKAPHPGAGGKPASQTHIRNLSTSQSHRMNIPLSYSERKPVIPNPNINQTMNPNMNPNINQNIEQSHLAPGNVPSTTGPATQSQVPQSTLSLPPLEATQQHLLTPRRVAMAAKELKEKEKKVNLRRKKYRIIAIAVGALLLLGGGFYFFMDKKEPAQTNNDPATSGVYSTPIENVNAESKKTPTLVEGEASTDSYVGQEYLIKNVDKLKVVLKVRSGESTLLYAPTSKDEPKELTLKLGQTVTLDTAGKNYIWFRLGTPSNIEILVNDQQINTDAQDAEKSYIVKVE